MSPTVVVCLGIIEREQAYQSALALAESKSMAVKTAMLAGAPHLADRLFPQYFPPSPEDAAQDLEDRVEQDDLTPEAAADIERWLAEQSGTMTGADLMDSDGGWE